MELSLNLAWFAVAATLVWLWLRSESSEGNERRRQLIAILVLVAILFPAISVSDDLLAVQNASEADNYLRRDHLVPSGVQPLHPALAVIAPILFGGLGFTFSRLAAPGLPLQRPERPELGEIENRPPPVAA
jgi:hypothetical protein